MRNCKSIMWQSVYRSFSISLGYNILCRKLGADCTALPIQRAAYNKEVIEKIHCLRTADIHSYYINFSNTCRVYFFLFSNFTSLPYFIKGFMILQTVHLHHWTRLCIVFGYILFRDYPTRSAPMRCRCCIVRWAFTQLCRFFNIARPPICIAANRGSLYFSGLRRFCTVQYRRKIPCGIIPPQKPCVRTSRTSLLRTSQPSRRAAQLSAGMHG